MLKCTNKIHEYTLFGILIIWQMTNDTWCITDYKKDRNTMYFAFYKTQRNDFDFVINNIIIWKLNIKFGFYK